MDLLYCGGRFRFDYLEKDYETRAAEDYRAVLLKDVDSLLKGSGTIAISESLSYVGPYYFESDGMVDNDIVETERRQIEKCTRAVFLLEDAQCPGTIGEMIYAASLQKRISIYYIRDLRETESVLQCSCWYPVILCRQINKNTTDIISCADIVEAKTRIIEDITNSKDKE